MKSIFAVLLTFIVLVPVALGATISGASFAKVYKMWYNSHPTAPLVVVRDRCDNATTMLVNGKRIVVYHCTLGVQYKNPKAGHPFCARGYVALNGYLRRTVIIPCSKAFPAATDVA
jgi:hypothetical protein